MGKEIHIQEVVSTMRSDEAIGDTFFLRFIRSTGKRKGSKAQVAKARYGAPRRHRDQEDGKEAGLSGPRTPKWRHDEAGTLPMTDTERNRYFTPLISHIVGFNDYEVKH